MVAYHLYFHSYRHFVNYRFPLLELCFAPLLQRKFLIFMKKYWTIFKVNWQVMLTYRANIVLWFLTAVVQTAFLLYLWIAVYDSGGKIGNYSFQELFTYYVLQLIIYQVATTFISWDIIQEIKDGNFSQYLLKPVNYFKWQFTSNLSFKAAEIVFSISGLIIVVLAAQRYLLMPDSMLTLLHTIVLTILSAILAFLLEFIIGITAFWIINAHNLRMLVSVFNRFFSGSLIPLTLLPGPLIIISQFLPFPFLSYVPVQVYLGKINIGNAYAGMIFWIIFMAIFAYYYFKLSIKRYEAVGA